MEMPIRQKVGHWFPAGHLNITIRGANVTLKAEALGPAAAC